MLIVRSVNGVAVRLTDERWGHIARRHPEMADQRERVLETVNTPDSIIEGDEGAIMASAYNLRLPSRVRCWSYRTGSFRPTMAHCDSVLHESGVSSENPMDALRILESPEALTWEYDEEADVLYISIGEPRPAVTVDLGESILARYDEEQRDVVGITILNVRRRLLEGLSAQGAA